MIMNVTVIDTNEKVKYPYQLLKSIQDLELMVTTASQGDIFKFGVLRGGRLFPIEVVVGQHPGEFDRSGRLETEGTADSSDFF
jgi:hypothetical protein